MKIINFSCKFAKTRLYLLLLFVLLTGTVNACYQPVDFSVDETSVPYVYCILNHLDTQYLELRYLSKPGKGEYQGIDEAEVTITEWQDINKPEYYRSFSFTPLGNGLWRLILPEGKNNKLQAHSLCSLRVCLPGSDTLKAATTMPGEITVKPFYSRTKQKRISQFDLNGKHYEYYPGRPYGEPDPDVYIIDDRIYFSLPVVIGDAVWAYKVSWSEKQQDWFVEDYLATDHDSWTDGFNVTGTLFTESTEPMALEVYPETRNQPLHYRYLRFYGGRPPGTPDTCKISISGNFSGPHYGNVSYIREIAETDQLVEKWLCSLNGLEYADNILTTHHAGYMEFKTVSKEYDLYLKDLAEFDLLHNVSNDIIGIYNNTNTYTNIQGGTGVFGAEKKTKFYWTCGVWQF